MKKILFLFLLFGACKSQSTIDSNPARSTIPSSFEPGMEILYREFTGIAGKSKSIFFSTGDSYLDETLFGKNFHVTFFVNETERNEILEMMKKKNLDKVKMKKQPFPLKDGSYQALYLLNKRDTLIKIVNDVNYIVNDDQKEDFFAFINFISNIAEGKTENKKVDFNFMIRTINSTENETLKEIAIDVITAGVSDKFKIGNEEENLTLRVFPGTHIVNVKLFEDGELKDQKELEIDTKSRYVLLNIENGVISK